MTDAELLHEAASWARRMGSIHAAVADWLDAAAEHDETACPAVDHAVTVARAYLGRPA